MAQILVPVADIAAGSWTTTPLWSDVDDDSESSPTGDGTVITSDGVGNNIDTSDADLELPVSGITDPAVSTGHIIRTRWFQDSTSSRTLQAHCELWQGVPDTGTLIAALVSATDVGTTEVTGTYTLTATEADNITDYNDLHLRLWGRGTSGGPSRALVVDLCELEVPNPTQTIAVGVITETDALIPVAVVQGPLSVGTLAEIDSLVPLLAPPFHIGDFLGATGAFQGHQNPVHQIGADLFIIERLNNTDIGVYKSTDNGAAWSQVATVTGIPPGAQTFHTLATTVDSGDIHVITSAAGGEIKYHIFDPGTDTFTLSQEIVSPDILVGSTNRVVGVVVRSDGSVVCLYRTTSTPFVIKYAIRNGSWTNDLAISADDDVDSLHTAAIVLGASDRVHFFWHNHTDGTIYHRTLNSADVLQTEQLVTSPGTGPVDIDNYSAGRYTKSGGVRIGYFYETSARKLSVIHADSADAPSWTQDSDITDEQIPDGLSQHRLLAGLVGDDTNEQFILAFQRSDLSVFFSLRPDGGSWGPDTDTGLDALDDGNDDLSSGDFGIRVSGGIVFLNWWSIASQTPPDDWLYTEFGFGQEVAIGSLAETESLIPIGVSIYKTIGTLAEANTLINVNIIQPTGQTIQVGTMVEVGSLLDIPGAKIVAIGTLTELEGLQSIIGIHVVNIGTLLEADTQIPVGLDILLTMDLFIAIDLTDALTLAQVQAALGLGTPKSGDHVAKIYHPVRRIVRR